MNPNAASEENDEALNLSDSQTDEPLKEESSRTELIKRAMNTVVLGVLQAANNKRIEPAKPHPMYVYAEEEEEEERVSASDFHLNLDEEDLRDPWTES